MRKLFCILTGLVLALSLTGCRSEEDDMDARIQANREEYIRILRKTGRPGVDAVISHLDSTDFFTRGAAGHHTEPGGLVQHSLEVYRIMKWFAWFRSSDSIAVVALFHDMGKIDTDGWHPWRAVRHLAEWGFRLEGDEYYAIFYHHKPGWEYYSRSPLRRSLSAADLVSAGWWKLWHW